MWANAVNPVPDAEPSLCRFSCQVHGLEHTYGSVAFLKLIAMNELGGFVGMVFILGIALLLIYINVLILRWMFKIDHIVMRLNQIATGINKLNEILTGQVGSISTQPDSHPAPAGSVVDPGTSSSPPSTFEEQQAAYRAKHSRGGGDIPNIPMR